MTRFVLILAFMCLTKLSLADDQILFPADCVVHSLIGQGSFVRVYACTREDGTQYALKRSALPADPDKRQSVVNGLWATISIAKQVKPLHFITPTGFYKVVIDGGEDAYYSIEELGVDAEAFVSRLSIPERRKIAPLLMMTLLLAANELEQRGFVHRDFKLANVVVIRENIDSKPLETFKSIDFNLSSQVERNTERAKGCAGTPEFMAPEAMIHHYTTHKSDVWSIGVIFWRLLTGLRFHQVETVTSGKEHKQTIRRNLKRWDSHVDLLLLNEANDQAKNPPLTRHERDFLFAALRTKGSNRESALKLLALPYFDTVRPYLYGYTFPEKSPGIIETATEPEFDALFVSERNIHRFKFAGAGFPLIPISPSPIYTGGSVSYSTSDENSKHSMPVIDVKTESEDSSLNSSDLSILFEPLIYPGFSQLSTFSSMY